MTPSSAARAATAVVVGGANLDLVGISRAPVLAGTSNPGQMLVKPGGVGRNVAENIARLGSAVHLVAGIGTDPLGHLVREATAAAGVGLDHAIDVVTTGTYTALLDHDGELVAAISDMRACDHLSPSDLTTSLGAALARLGTVEVLVVDANLSPEALVAATALVGPGTRIVAEPVSVPKAGRLRSVIDQGVHWFAVTPNADELPALTGIDETGAAVEWLHAHGVQHVWLRRGRNGSVLYSRGRAPESLPSLPAEVVDVTGAGDAMLGAFVHALLLGHDVAEAARWGHAAACLTVESTDTVRTDLSHDLVQQTLRERTPR